MTLRFPDPLASLPVSQPLAQHLQPARVAPIFERGSGQAKPLPPPCQPSNFHPHQDHRRQASFLISQVCSLKHSYKLFLGCLDGVNIYCLAEPDCSSDRVPMFLPLLQCSYKFSTLFTKRGCFCLVAPSLNNFRIYPIDGLRFLILATG